MTAPMPAFRFRDKVDLIGVMSAIMWSSISKDALTGDSGVESSVDTAVKLLSAVGNHPVIKPSGRG